ncbi:uncharacterized protein LOC109523262 isoform X4 [Hippocampus comes]|uniref:uncharacterized protein LOC109523262 isoform X4 n=1 Tax=Hippocampus comes TaxID=109280 RepID=UPI00094ECD2D|nr:PREDICTED: uncharacterized protein LOC109523262 isoform X4 [Hippocampus comes]
MDSQTEEPENVDGKEVDGKEVADTPAPTATTEAAQDTVKDPKHLSAKGMEMSVEDPNHPSAEGMEMSVEDPKPLSAEGMEMSVEDPNRPSAEGVEMSVEDPNRPSAEGVEMSVKDPKRLSAEGMEMSAEDPNRPSAEGMEMSTGDPKRRSAESLEMSVLYDAPGNEEASKCKIKSCVPARGFCFALGFVLILLCILIGWYWNDSKLNQLKEQLRSMEENTMRLEKLVETMRRIPQTNGLSPAKAPAS